MKNIYEILKSFGLEVPEDKKADFDKMLNENYKTQAEVNNLNGKLTKAESERDALQVKYNDDIKQRDTDLADLKQKLADAGTDYQKQLNKQAYEFAIKEKTNGLQFTSNSAKKAFLSDALAKNLTMDNGNILGFDDFVNAYKEQDAGAFVVETTTEEPKPPMFGSKSTKKDEPSPKADEPKERPLIW